MDIDYKLPAPADYLAMTNEQLEAEIKKINGKIDVVSNLLATCPEKRAELIDRMAQLKALRQIISDRVKSRQ